MVPLSHLRRRRTTKTNSEISDALSSLVNKIMNIEIQISVLYEDLKIKIAVLNKRIKDLESSLEKPRTRLTYSGIAGASSNINTANKKPKPKPVILKGISH
jgi:hypothetical protein